MERECTILPLSTSIDAFAIGAVHRGVYVSPVAFESGPGRNPDVPAGVG